MTDENQRAAAQKAEDDRIARDQESRLSASKTKTMEDFNQQRRDGK